MKDDCLIFSDCHGAYHTLVRLLNRAPKGLKVVSAGDEIDRGPNSRKVVEFVMTNKVPSVASNHVDLCLAYSEHVKRGYKAHCTREYDRDVWLHNGGRDALKNWPIPYSPDLSKTERKTRGRIPDDVLSWMAALPPYLYPSEQLDENGRKLLVSHCGYGLNADTGHWLSTLWGRYPDDGPFKRDKETGESLDDGLYRVFGHTRTVTAEVTEVYSRIDTGAAYGEPHGILSALLWPSKTILTQPFDETPCEPTFTITDGRLT